MNINKNSSIVTIFDKTSGINEILARINTNKMPNMFSCKSFTPPFVSVNEKQH